MCVMTGMLNFKDVGVYPPETAFLVLTPTHFLHTRFDDEIEIGKIERRQNQKHLNKTDKNFQRIWPSTRKIKNKLRYIRRSVVGEMAAGRGTIHAFTNSK